MLGRAFRRIQVQLKKYEVCEQKSLFDLFQNEPQLYFSNS